MPCLWPPWRIHITMDVFKASLDIVDEWVGRLPGRLNIEGIIITEETPDAIIGLLGLGLDDLCPICITSIICPNQTLGAPICPFIGQMNGIYAERILIRQKRQGCLPQAGSIADNPSAHLS